MPISFLFIPVFLYYILAVFTIKDFCQIPSLFIAFSMECISSLVFFRAYKSSLACWWSVAGVSTKSYGSGHLCGICWSFSSNRLRFYLLQFCCFWFFYISFQSRFHEQGMSPNGLMCQIFLPCHSSKMCRDLYVSSKTFCGESISTLALDPEGAECPFASRYWLWKDGYF